MVCSIDDIVSRRPGKHTRFPVAYFSLFIYRFFFYLSVSLSLSLSFFSFCLFCSIDHRTSPFISYRFSSLSLHFHSRLAVSPGPGIGISNVTCYTLLGTVRESSSFHLSRGNGFWKNSNYFEQCSFDTCRTCRT